MRRITLLLIFIFAINFQLFGQSVTGTVTDGQTGDALVGVNILVKGTSIGTTTDDDGHYSLSVPSLQDTLRFSYIGYQTKIVPVNGRKTINISMKPTVLSGQQLVVVGYGTEKKKNIVGGVSSVKPKHTASRSAPGIARLLKGQVPGLNIKRAGGSSGGNPAAEPQINIRGFNSINGGSPLVLVDGVQQPLSSVNPNNVESVTVLKDAEAAAIYGSRAAFGVVLITTKKAEPGHFVISYSNNIGTSTTTARRDFLLNPYKYAKIIDAAIRPRSSPHQYSQYTTESDWEKAKKVANGELAPFKEKNPDGTYTFFYKTDWWHLRFRKWRPHQIHNISISGGSKKVNARFSGRIYKRTLIENLVDQELNKYNLNFSLKYNPFKWLNLSFSQKLEKRNHNSFGGTKNGYVSPWTSSGYRDEFVFYPAILNGTGVSVGRSHNGYVGRVPALLSKANWKKWDTQNLVTTLQGQVDPVKGLEFHFQYSYINSRQSIRERAKHFNMLKGNTLTLTEVGQNYLINNNFNKQYQSINAYGIYNLTVKNKHNFKLELGFNQEVFHRRHISSEVKNLLSENKSSPNLGTDFFNIGGSTRDWALQGFFGRLDYNYKETYLLEINARYDGSSRFPERNRWGFFPSIGIGWRVSNEDFWPDTNNVFSLLKIRASFGQLGNQEVPLDTFRRLVGVGLTSWLVNGKKLNYARVPAPLPQSIGWEVVTSGDLGLNVGFLDDKVNASLDLYQRTTSNMYLPGQPLPAVFGAKAPKMNYATLRNRGFEVSLGYSNTYELFGSPLSLNVSANVSNFKGVITKFYNPKGVMSSFWNGEVLGTLWGYHVAGQFQSDKAAAAYENSFEDPIGDLSNVYRIILTKSNGTWGHLRAGDPKYIDTNGDGEIDNGSNTLKNHGDLRPIGNAMPKFPFGFSIYAKWHNFDIAIIGQGIGHQDWYPTSMIFWGSFERPYAAFIRKDLAALMWDSEASDNSKNIYPQPYRGYTANNNHASLRTRNDYYLRNIGFLRLKNLTIGYTLPQRITEKINIKSLRIYATGENIWTVYFDSRLTHYIDPELVGGNISYSNPNSATTQGHKNAAPYPMGKTFSVGIQIDL